MEITKENLQKQIADLEAMEKQAWAQVNYIVGQKDMCLHLLAGLEKEPGPEPEEAVQEIN